MPLEGITAFEAQWISRLVEGAAAYRFELRVWFPLLERMHGRPP